MHPREITVPTTYNMWILHMEKLIHSTSLNKRRVPSVSLCVRRLYCMDKRKLLKNTINSLVKLLLCWPGWMVADGARVTFHQFDGVVNGEFFGAWKTRGYWRPGRVPMMEFRTDTWVHINIVVTINDTPSCVDGGFVRRIISTRERRKEYWFENGGRRRRAVALP